jgi:putative ABC transport system permease protein
LVAAITGSGSVYCFRCHDHWHHDSILSAKGFSEEQIISIDLTDRSLFDKGLTLKNELSQIPTVEQIAFSATMPGRGIGRTRVRPEGYPEEDVWIVSIMSIDDQFIPTMDMKIIDGRNYDRSIASDSAGSVIINQAAALALGWTDPIGKKIGFGQGGSNERTVVGVVQDFHFANMRHKIEPVVITYRPGSNGVLSLKISQTNLTNTLGQLEEIWGRINPSHPFEYSFFDQEFGEQYARDEIFFSLVMGFTILAIFIACLGLIGLSMFTAEQRLKEIGIRKVMGASIRSIIILLSSQFTKPVIMACLLALPITYYFVKDWLQGFAYHVDIPWLSFGAACILALMIAQLTVGVHALRAASSNPIDALRDE